MVVAITKRRSSIGGHRIAGSVGWTRFIAPVRMAEGLESIVVIDFRRREGEGDMYLVTQRTGVRAYTVSQWY